MKNILITGGAGFIGSSLIGSLIENPDINITCLDNFDNFYDPRIKKNNIKTYLKKNNFILIKGDICNLRPVKRKFSKRYDAIIHLAAKVGVIPSIKDPVGYTEVNIGGTQNLLEFAKEIRCKKFIFASSSSIYGVNSNFPWREYDRNILPISPYAATKISGELLGHVYSHLYNFQFVALRFFTAYGPRQRPDLAIHKFTKLILEGKPVTLYGDGKTKRDYTYIDDIISGISSALKYDNSKFEIINIGNNQPVELNEIIFLLEKALRKKAAIRGLPEQPGDVPLTFADIRKAKKLLGYEPNTNLSTGLQKFVSWFRQQNEENKQ
ncbi:MAG: GDP-mannose 4,6-dehydratase [Candidatus Levybacteria bacterium]|nr:GDP-mannose 4,6-dehydratase [Candidatus Levybacteria bacterium]